ncbi:hypothetical protein G9A89_001866 [Geosiphon pyriformis]|nr:hypothetical protein G9A89_001866 [Geosiphon pyriformis]
MTYYSPPLIIYIVLNLFSSTLLVLLLVIIHKSPGFFTKWTLSQLCISAFFSQISNLPPLLKYGENLRQKAFETSLCIIAQKFGQFFFHPIQIFPLAIIFYLWYGIWKNEITIEKRWGWKVSAGIWGLNSLYQGVKLIISSKYEHWGVDVNRLYCKGTSYDRDWLAFLIPSVITLGEIFKEPNQRHSDKIRSSDSIARLLSKKIPDANALSLSEYTGSIIGIVLFLIFGAHRSAACFLPCFYYKPTDSDGIKNIMKLRKQNIQSTRILSFPEYNYPINIEKNSQNNELESNTSTLTRGLNNDINDLNPWTKALNLPGNDSKGQVLDSEELEIQITTE